MAFEVWATVAGFGIMMADFHQEEVIRGLVATMLASI